ncbi:hypothetical protein M406DRAFT_350904 [Cryphonectria parasitica EP155]|uniref:Uncharacterized protein n=1 Tax=Cryphonectria parasitica (strain ATCC 38755 / EP155) TaxID=660469 RepID=A0A9P5CRB8_CRYP1|nr:uncharacterized protein M406DRAFT_350904 [Cryphonectria parasitica EP155]KAF3768093.1 hypothetical protein M406DRAFT_350904 [Cryphonectria parasitica EP155]
MASVSFNFKTIATLLILGGCSAFGAYATIGTGLRTGLFAALRKGAGPKVAAESKRYLAGPEPYKTTFTGLPFIDNQLCTLVGFFTVLLDGPKTLDVSLVSWYLFTQLLAGWILVSLEGLRQGNQGRIVSRTGTLGFIFQIITFTVAVPIWLIIHVLTSPLSQSTPSANALAIDVQDLYILPKVVFSAFVLPGFLMFLPSPDYVSATAHYNWQAVWQVFPVAQSIYHWFYKRTTALIDFKSSKAPEQLNEIYRFVLILSFVPQTALLVLAATPAHLVPHAVESFIPGITQGIVSQIDITKAFIPDLPWDLPIVHGAEGVDAVSVSVLVKQVKMFLQWDIYCGGLALLTWSAFVYSAALPGKAFLSTTLPKALWATVFGGPVGAATLLLWDRDTAVRERSTVAKPVVTVKGGEKKKKVAL